MDFETYLRVNLDSKNHAGRSLAEHRLEVTEPLPGVLVIRIYPEGFNANAEVFQVQAGTITRTTDLVLAKMREDALAAETAAQHERDLNVQAERMEREEREGVEEAKRRVAEREEAAKSRPMDLAKALPDGDPAP